jgi:hypothetical protein
MEVFTDDPKRTPEDPAAIHLDTRRVTGDCMVTFDMVDEGGAVAVFSRIR